MPPDRAHLAQAELALAGIPCPPTMNEMDIRLMLVETRMRKSGKMGSDGGGVAPPPKPASFANEFERAMYEHPAFTKLFNAYQAAGDTNKMNVCSEYLNDPKNGRVRYGKQYPGTIDDIDAAMAAPVVQEVTTPRVGFSNFPGNLGEAGIEMTLGAVGPLSSFEAKQGVDSSWSGVAEFGDVATAKAAISKYDGMDMGTGTKLQLTALS